jgi:hypothetical protein
MRLKRPTPAMVVALIALFMSMTGGAIAAVNFARNAGAVDGKSAVGSGASLKRAGGKLVAANGSGQIPFKFLDGAATEASVERLSGLVARGRNSVDLTAVEDNQTTVAKTLINMELGDFQVSCYDQANAVGNENAATRITITNHSGAAINLSRRVGVAAPIITNIPNNVVDTFDVGKENTFEVHLQGTTNKTVLLQGTARNVGEATPSSACAVWATAIIVE